MQWLVGISAIRFFAIILIIIYHLFRPVLPGGFIAVEIFFTISGFLITAKLLKDFCAKRKIEYFKFIEMRLLRLLPTLLVCIVMTLLLAFLVHPDVLSGMRDNTLAAITFTTNIKELITGGSYENVISPNLFEHTWFLALEMQFYLIIPIIITLTVGQFKNARTGARCLLVTLIVGAIASIALMATYGGIFGMPNRAYFAIDSHLAGFCLGGALAAFNFLIPRTPRTKKSIPAAGVALSLIIITILSTKLSFDNPITFCFGLPFTGLLTTIIIFCIIKLQPNVHVRQRISVPIRIFERLGEYSYGLYLFHWPLYILLPYIFQNYITSSQASCLAILLSIVLSYISFKFINITTILKKYKSSTQYRVALTAILIVFVIPSVFSLARMPQRSSISEQLSEQKGRTVTIEKKAKKENYFGTTDAIDATLDAMRMQLDITTNQSSDEGNGANAASSANTAQVLVIGDSVTLGAKEALEKTIDGVFVDAVESRGIWSARNILATYAASGRLPDIIVISLITNEATISDALLQGIVDTAGPDHTFIFVTGYAGPRQPREVQNIALKEYVNKNSNMFIADWWLLSHDNWSLMYADHIHLNPEGRKAYANLINGLVRSIKK